MVWIDDENVAHTVALPDPTVVMTDEFRTSLDTIADGNRAALQGIVESAEMRAYASDWSDMNGAETHASVAPPGDLLKGRIVRPEDLASAIEQVDLRWRLDVIMALDDYME
jgi:hypothetical protein